MLHKHVSLRFLTYVLRLLNIRRIHFNLVSDPINHVSSCLPCICPHAKKHKDRRMNHKEKSMRRNHKEGIVYIYAKTIWQTTYVKHMVLMLCSLLMVYAYLLTLFLHEDGASPLGCFFVQTF